MRSALRRSAGSTALPPRWISTGSSTLSSVVRHGSNSGFWNMKPVRRSASGCAISPPAGSTRPAIALSNVDLPHPLGPSSETNSPRRTVRLKLSIAATLPKRTLRSSIERMGLDGATGAASSRSVKTIAFMATAFMAPWRRPWRRRSAASGIRRRAKASAPRLQPASSMKPTGLSSGLSSGTLAFIIASSWS